MAHFARNEEQVFPCRCFKSSCPIVIVVVVVIGEGVNVLREAFMVVVVVALVASLLLLLLIILLLGYDLRAEKNFEKMGKVSK